MRRDLVAATVVVAEEVIVTGVEIGVESGVASEAGCFGEATTSAGGLFAQQLALKRW